MTIRERLNAKVAAGTAEETLELGDGSVVIIRGREDVQFLREAWLLDDKEADEEAAKVSKVLKSRYKIEPGITANEFKECRLISLVAFDEKREPLDVFFAAAMCRTDGVGYLAILSVAMRVSGLMDMMGVTAGNSAASAGGSDSSVASSGLPANPPASSPAKGGRSKR